MKKIILAIAVLVVLLWASNTSLFYSYENESYQIIAHRGVHQTYDHQGLESDTCTADRILKSDHAFLENTIPSMRQAFESGAQVVELDVHPTTDNKLAVFHDWSLDCRTDGSGRVRDHDMSYLRSLDVGYEYTFDGGQSFPFRGAGIGQMPTLSEVLATFPDGQFLINFKSDVARDGHALTRLIAVNPNWKAQIAGVYGGHKPMMAVVDASGTIPGYSKVTIKSCLSQYIAVGWSGMIPDDCKNTLIVVPVNYAPYLWGWPLRFQNRVRQAGSKIILTGPVKWGKMTQNGFDDRKELEAVPKGFSGYIWTNRIELIGYR